MSVPVHLPHRDAIAMRDHGVMPLDEAAVDQLANNLRKAHRDLKLADSKDHWQEPLARMLDLIQDIKTGVRCCTVAGILQDRGGIGHQIAIMAVYGRFDNPMSCQLAKIVAEQLGFMRRPFREWVMGFEMRMDDGGGGDDDDGGGDDDEPEAGPDGGGGGGGEGVDAADDEFERVMAAAANGGKATC